MNTKKFLILPGLFAMLLLALWIAGLASAQVDVPGADPEQDLSELQPAPHVEATTTIIYDQAGEPEAGNVPTGPNILLIANDIIQVQGRLTTATGDPVSGSRLISATIYDASSGGIARCTDSDSVTVENGLFTMAMDFCTADDINGDALYLGIKVGDDPEMTPRQEIGVVPYAYALRPGAIVKGADSYFFISGSSLVKNLSADTTRWNIQSNGAARIWRGATVGSKTIFLPVMLPAELYGQTVTLKQMTVYYKVSNATNGFIDRTVMNVMTLADNWVNVVDDNTNRTATVASNYSLDFTTNNVISSTQGNVVVFFTLAFENDIDYIDIGGIRLRLGHQ